MAAPFTRLGCTRKTLSLRARCPETGILCLIAIMIQILAFILFFGLVSLSRENMLQNMPRDAAFWSRYHQNFQRVFDSARPSPPSGSRSSLPSSSALAIVQHYPQGHASPPGHFCLIFDIEHPAFNCLTKNEIVTFKHQNPAQRRVSTLTLGPLVTVLKYAPDSIPRIFMDIPRISFSIPPIL